MKKIIIAVGLALVLGFLLLIVWAWNFDKLFFYVPGVKITINGQESDKSVIYRSKNGNYFVFLEKDKAKDPVYLVMPNNRIGVPTDIVPSLSTLSFKTPYFLLCLDFEIEMAGTDFFARDAKSFISKEEINFQVNTDVVNINLNN